MKLIVFALSGLFLAGCAHTAKELATPESALLMVCPKNITGCADKIIMEKTDYLIDATTEEAKQGLYKLTKKRNSKEFKKIKVTVQGYPVKEKGHFPNPMAEFDVFKLNTIATK